MQITQYPDAIWDAKYSIISAFDSYIRYNTNTPHDDIWTLPDELLTSQSRDREIIEKRLNSINKFLKEQVDKAHEDVLKQLFAADFK